MMTSSILIVASLIMILELRLHYKPQKILFSFQGIQTQTKKNSLKSEAYGSIGPNCVVQISRLNNQKVKTRTFIPLLALPTKQSEVPGPKLSDSLAEECVIPNEEDMVRNKHVNFFRFIVLSLKELYLNYTHDPVINTCGSFRSSTH